MADNTLSKTADWLQIIGSVPLGTQLVMGALPAIALVGAWFAALSPLLIVGTVIGAVAVSFGLGMYIGRLRTLPKHSKTEADKIDAAEVPMWPPTRTAVRIRGSANVELDEPLIAGHDVGLDIDGDPTVKVKNPTIL